MPSDAGILPSIFPSQTVASMIEQGWLAINDGYRVKRSELGSEGIPFVRGGDIGDGWITTTVEDHVLSASHDKLRPKLTEPGDVAFITKGTVGRVGRLRPGQPTVVFAPQVCYWRSLNKSKLSSGYIFYLLQSRWFQAHLDGVKTSGSMVADYVSLRDQQHFRLPIPPIDEQRRIAAVLGALDDKIELNRKMNRTLEEMAQAIFKSWFIDFDGVPDSEMVESELGPIPKGWELRPVDEIIQVNPKTKLTKGTKATFVDMKAVPTTGCSVSEVVRKEMTGGGAKFVQGDTLLARITPCLENGKTALVNFLAPGEAAFGSTEFIVMRPTGSFGREWVYCLARSAEFRQHAISNMTGSSGRQRVPVDCFSHFTIPEPPATKAKEFAAATASLFDRIKANADQSRTLADLRDALLPKLISGEIRVPEAEDAVEAAR